MAMVLCCSIGRCCPRACSLCLGRVTRRRGQPTHPHHGCYFRTPNPTTWCSGIAQHQSGAHVGALMMQEILSPDRPPTFHQPYGTSLWQSPGTFVAPLPPPERNTPKLHAYCPMWAASVELDLAVLAAPSRNERRIPTRPRLPWPTPSLACSACLPGLSGPRAASWAARKYHSEAAMDLFPHCVVVTSPQYRASEVSNVIIVCIMVIMSSQRGWLPRRRTFAWTQKPIFGSLTWDTNNSPIAKS
jgi:hypothetical protein